jgi:alanyl-tRNA synthetase
VVARGALAVGDAVRAEVDAERRDAVRRNHTATHLLHLALKQVLGEHVRQEGSLVAPDRLRFDFRHDHGLGEDEVRAIEGRVNDWILRNDEVRTEVLPLEAAKASGAVSLFGEKYGEVVRVLSVESGSRELCGGTHCARTGDIGSFRVTLETSIAAGVRRLEAVTGRGAVEAAAADRERLAALSAQLKAGADELAARVAALQEEVKAQRKAQERQAREAGTRAARDLLDQSRVVGGLRVLVASLPGVDAKGLKGVADSLAQGGVDAAALVGEQDGRAPLVALASKAAQERGVDARVLLQALTGAVGGGGGGSPGRAQGQGQDRSGVERALGAARAALEQALGAAFA